MRFIKEGSWIAMVFCCISGLFGTAMAKDFLYVPVVNQLQIIDCDTDTVVKNIPYNDYIMHAVYSPDGKRYYLNAFHSIYVIDTTTQELIDTYRLSSELSKVTVLGMAVSEDGKKLYLSCSIVKKKQNIPKLNVLPPQLVVFDTQKKKMVKNYPVPYNVLGVFTLRNDTEHLILAGLDLFRLNLKNGEVEKVMGLLNPEADEKAKNFLVFWKNSSPGDHGVLVNPYYTATGMGYILIDRNTGEIRDLKGKDVWFEYSNLLSNDKKHIFAVMDELVKIDAETGETVKSVAIDRGTAYAMSLTADGKKLYVGPSGADVSVYNADTLELLRVIPLEGDGILAHRISM